MLVRNRELDPPGTCRFSSRKNVFAVHATPFPKDWWGTTAGVIDPREVSFQTFFFLGSLNELQCSTHPARLSLVVSFSPTSLTLTRMCNTAMFNAAGLRVSRTLHPAMAVAAIVAKRIAAGAKGRDQRYNRRYPGKRGGYSHL